MFCITSHEVAANGSRTFIVSNGLHSVRFFLGGSGFASVTLLTEPINQFHVGLLMFQAQQALLRRFNYEITPTAMYRSREEVIRWEGRWSIPNSLQ